MAACFAAHTFSLANGWSGVVFQNDNGVRKKELLGDEQCKSLKGCEAGNLYVHICRSA